MRKFMIVVLGQSLGGLIQPQRHYNQLAYLTATAVIFLAFGFKILYVNVRYTWTDDPTCSSVVLKWGTRTRSISSISSFSALAHTHI